MFTDIGYIPQGAWVWLADHDLDLAGENRITVYSGRGILSESKGPVWLIGTACMFLATDFDHLN